MHPETKHGSVEDKPRDDNGFVDCIIIESLHNPIADA